MAKVDFGEADVAGPPHPAPTHALGQRSFDARTFVVLTDILCGLLTRAALAQCLILFLWPNGDEPSRGALCRTNTLIETWTGLAVLRREPDLDDCIAAVIDHRGPLHAGLPFRTACLLTLPIDAEVLCVEALPFPGLPLDVRPRRTQEIDTVVPLARDHEFRVQKAGIDDVLLRQPIHALEVSVNLRRSRPVCDRRGRCRDVRNQVRTVRLTGFRQCHLVADPARCVLLPQMGVHVVGRAEKERCGWDTQCIRAPLELVVLQVEILEPNAAQRLQRRHFAQPTWRIRRIDGRKQDVAVRPNRPREFCAGVFPCWETPLLRPTCVAFGPLWCCMRLQLAWRSDGETIECMPHRFGNNLDAVQCTHGGQDMRRIGALVPMRLEQLSRTAPSEERIEPELLGAAGE